MRSVWGESKRGIVATYEVEAALREEHIADLLRCFADRALDDMMKGGYAKLRKGDWS